MAKRITNVVARLGELLEDDVELASTFGDILAIWESQRSIRTMAASQITSWRVAKDSTSRESALPSAEVLLVGAGHDLRSGRRLAPIQTQLSKNSIRSTIWQPGASSSLPGWNARDTAGSRYRLGTHEYRRLRSVVDELSADFKLQGWESIALRRWLAVQKVRLRIFDELVDWNTVKMVVADFDRGLPAAPLVLAAKRRDVPTYTLVHGDPNAVGYTPFIAKNVFCWNSRQLKNLKSWSSEPFNGYVSGAHWVAPNSSTASSGRSGNRCLVVHTGGDDLTKFLNQNRPLFSQLLNSFEVAVRPHPMHSSSRTGKSPVRITSGTLSEDLAWADCVLSYSSSVGLDAVHMSKRAAVLEEGGLPLASIDGLKFTRDAALPDGWAYLPSKDSSWPFAATGDAALSRVVQRLLCDLKQ